MRAEEDKTEQLYDPRLLDAARNSHRFGRNTDASHRGSGLNALCGDKVTIELNIEDDVVQRYTFRAAGCVICIGAAALVGDLVEGTPTDTARKLAEEFRSDLRGGRTPSAKQLAPLRQVVEFPARHGCADLAPATLIAALDQSNTTISTE